MTDEELIAKVAAARARVTFVYPDLEQQPRREPVALADCLPKGITAETVDADTAAVKVDTWEPTCLGCGEVLGYTTKSGSYYEGMTQCAKCRAGNLAARLKASGISHREMDEDLDALVRPSADPVYQNWTDVATIELLNIPLKCGKRLDGKVCDEPRESPAHISGHAFAANVTDHIVAMVEAEIAKRDAEFGRYMDFLRRFAALKPGQRINPPFAFAYGQLGTGKTAGAERAMRDAIRNGCAGRVVRFSDLVRKINDTFRRTEENRDERTEDVLRAYAGAHLLIVHEVGPDADTDHALGLFFDFVDDRHQAELPTIFTSNYAPDSDSLGARMGSRAVDDVRVRGIIDRITGGVEENVFCLLGPSWRGRRKAAA